MSKHEIINAPQDGAKLSIREILQPFLDEGFPLIPLNGKKPADSRWTTREYDNEETIALCVRQGLNVGVRLPSDVVVVDIDPRNGATEAVISNLGVDVRANPWCVQTGGGGWHSYYRKPAGVRIVGALKEVFPGVDFKTKGGQVVAPGSEHPATGKVYEWTDGPPCFDHIPDMPKTFLDAITRPESTAAVTRGYRITPEQLGAVLEQLDPTDYPTSALWEPIMMASHHATGGEGLEEFVEFSERDPNFSDAAGEITNRWNSCDPNKEGGRTIGTLRAELAKKNALHVLPPDMDQPEQTSKAKTIQITMRRRTMTRMKSRSS